MSKIDTIKANVKEAALATYPSENTAYLIKKWIPFILDRLESLEAIADELAVGLTSWVEGDGGPDGSCIDCDGGPCDSCMQEAKALADYAAWIKDGESCPA